MLDYHSKMEVIIWRVYYTGKYETNFQILQGSVATLLRHGGRFHASLVCSSSQNKIIIEIGPRLPVITKILYDCFLLTHSEVTKR